MSETSLPTAIASNTIAGLENNRDFFRNEQTLLQNVQNEVRESLSQVHSQFEEISQTSRGSDGAFYDRVFGSVQETNSVLSADFEDFTDTISSDVRSCDIQIEETYEDQRKEILEEKKAEEEAKVEEEIEREDDEG